MKTSRIFSEGEKYKKILQNFDANHNSILYGISSEFDFNIPVIINDVLVKYIKEKKYPLLDVCKLIQDLFCKMNNTSLCSECDNIKDDFIEVISYLPDYMLGILKSGDVYTDDLDYDEATEKAKDFINEISGWRNVIISYTEEQDDIKAVDGMKQIVLHIPLDQCIILDSNYWYKIIDNIESSFTNSYLRPLNSFIIDEYGEDDNANIFVLGLDVSCTNSLVVLTEKIEKDWLVRSN